MSRKVCRRRHYALTNPISLAISGATITPESDLDSAKRWGNPASARNCCLSGAEVQAELLGAKDRYEAKGRMALTGPGLRALRDLYDMHDQQRTAVDRSAYERAITKTKNRIRSHHPDLKVIA